MHEYFFNNKNLTKQLILDKDRAISNYVKMMLNRTQQMFKYENLPDTIPQRMLEMYLQTSGVAIITEVNNNLYAFTGGLGGEPDPYYQPTLATIANPALKISDNLEIGKECEIIYSDSMWMGLLPLIQKYAILLAENDISMRTASINMRLTAILSVTDDRTKESALEYLRQIEKGQLGVLVDTKNLLTESDSFSVSPLAGSGLTSYISQLTEYNQYLKASLFNELGLQANYNMKRESLNSSETEMDSDVLVPLVDNMLECRKICLEKVNTLYGTNITVELASAWEDRQELRDMVDDTDIGNNEGGEQDESENIERDVS